ncbi:MAG: cyclic dehypoxanthinyl futalosine synthase [Candidatus Anammoxibacter sp.]
MKIEEIYDKVLSGSRIDKDEALSLLNPDNSEKNSIMPGSGLTVLGMMADKQCRTVHPEMYRTFIIDRNINYTNVCVAKCKFCAFYRDVNDDEAYVLSKESLFKKIEETIELGGAQILMQGGLHPDLDFNFYLDMLKSIKEKFKIHIHAFSPPEIIHFSSINGYSVSDTIKALNEAGLDSIPGGGAEILDDKCRKKISPGKCTTDEWLDVMKEAHNLGLRTTATMMFGHVESLDERINHLERIRLLQDETDGFTAFIPWTFQPKNTEIDVIPLGGFEYLKMVAVSRIYLDNIKNIQASWVTQGSKIAQIALRFGANDMGSTMIEENVVRSAGVSYQMDTKDIIALIENIGYEARQRDLFYNV